MRIHCLTLEHFRLHDKRSFDFTKGDLHVFVGPNGSGKTNILESISILSHGSSCLGCEEQDLPTWGTEYYRVGADAVFDAGDPQTIEVFSQITPRKQKAAFVNGVRCPVSSIVGMLPTVLFLPQDLYLFTGPPSERRRFLDHPKIWTVTLPPVTRRASVASVAQLRSPPCAGHQRADCLIGR